MTDRPVLRLRDAAAGFGARTLWSGLDLDVARGEFLAVLGANGTGKTTLLRSILGLQPLRAGTLEIGGTPPRRGSSAVGYVPQERTLDPRAPIVAREFVALGLDGNRWGTGWPSARRRRAVDAALAGAGALGLADTSIGNLSGGEGQRVRIAQAVATDPSVLLCDEPLVSLDLRGQAEIAALIDRRRTEHGTAVVFVTHEINPVLPYVDRVLYLAGGSFKLGTVDEVMTSASLTALYDSPVEVIRSAGRILVAGMPDHHASLHEHASHRAHDASYEGSDVSVDLWSRVFDFSDYGELLGLVQNSIIAGAVLGVVGGVISVFVMYRDLPFAVHGTSELSFAGAAGFLLLGFNVVLGSLIGALLAATIIGWLGIRARDRNSVIGVLMPFGLGLGVLFLALYQGRSANKFGLLTGQIVAVDSPQLVALVVIGVVVLVALAIMWRPLVFASLDPEVAAARGVPVRLLSPIFMLVLGATVAAAVQVVGALLVLSVVCTPGAAALWVTTRRSRTIALSVTFGVVSVVGGILLALGGSLPISPYITTISFLCYLGCRITAWVRGRRSSRARPLAATPVGDPSAVEAVAA